MGGNYGELLCFVRWETEDIEFINNEHGIESASAPYVTHHYQTGQIMGNYRGTFSSSDFFLIYMD
jgi:hypothetical protein